MRRFWRRFALQFTRDDLFVRVAMLFAGTIIAALGGLILVATVFWPQMVIDGGEVGSFAHARYVVGGLVVMAWIFGLPMAVWGLLLVSRCFVPRQWRIARLAEKCAPDTVDAEGVLIFMICLIPIAFVTLGLRALGVSGQRDMPPPGS
jgi:hypothetical protein